MNTQPSLRFDHREIAVIFSLFVFVSLLMFTVGILVGKGLAQAKFDPGGGEARFSRTDPVDATARIPASSPPKSSGTEVSSGLQATTPEVTKEPLVTDSETSDSKPNEPLSLIPQKPKDGDGLGNSLLEPTKGRPLSDSILKNPKIQSLLEDDPTARRAPSAIAKIPESLATGKFTVQVGSYPAEKDAAERVDALKKLGFPYAHFSAKQLEDNKETWYRVWLGSYTDYKSANDSGRILKDRGEVKHYLVRKTDSPE
jgi:cell division protein FtsN